MILSLAIVCILVSIALFLIYFLVEEDDAYWHGWVTLSTSEDLGKSGKKIKRLGCSR